ncbi:hypothetical protein BCIN_18g00040 [Botrytis cinerea B05.10]|uniref:Uncharacterized protein n=1 Tax=Botryotinia fuckeliana (strain B05.10) TaxID=332648 RepID=A0A384K809_BOTFB|nr:hypothetical protein BCIN_18g00040 [Botrytis cinerea B05.10]ATZ58887.1 hypothetical protein BCIN_18g00040 [Botrytis cinerea B05.10]
MKEKNKTDNQLSIYPTTPSPSSTSISTTSPSSLPISPALSFDSDTYITPPGFGSDFELVVGSIMQDKLLIVEKRWKYYRNLGMMIEEARIPPPPCYQIADEENERRFQTMGASPTPSQSPSPSETPFSPLTKILSAINYEITWDHTRKPLIDTQQSFEVLASELSNLVIKKSYLLQSIP